MTKHCSFCDRTLAEVRRLIEGPGVSICDRCVAAAPSADADLTPAEACDFCRQITSEGYATPGATICPPCIDLCVDILREAEPALPRAIVHRERN